MIAVMHACVCPSRLHVLKTAVSAAAWRGGIKGRRAAPYKTGRIILRWAHSPPLSLSLLCWLCTLQSL